ncbi:hypothetical protein HF325_003221 [Metschnikowia pulcherrima]|uniref:Uncharacterized protein n=1 Tax=Metschnikowia pulcherrima TaxID=27326 RepID=A0A8H7GTT5_9ASCO|nr:hypothetical protein HF325_003221 [Metschnikowia pulcherrima]
MFGSVLLLKLFVKFASVSSQDTPSFRIRNRRSGFDSELSKNASGTEQLYNCSGNLSLQE